MKKKENQIKINIFFFKRDILIEIESTFNQISLQKKIT